MQSCTHVSCPTCLLKLSPDLEDPWGPCLTFVCQGPLWTFWVGEEGLFSPHYDKTNLYPTATHPKCIDKASTSWSSEILPPQATYPHPTKHPTPIFANIFANLKHTYSDNNMVLMEDKKQR